MLITQYIRQLLQHKVHKEGRNDRRFSPERSHPRDEKTICHPPTLQLFLMEKWQHLNCTASFPRPFNSTENKTRNLATRRHENKTNGIERQLYTCVHLLSFLGILSTCLNNLNARLAPYNAQAGREI